MIRVSEQARDQAAALGVVVDEAVARDLIDRQDPPIVDGQRTYRLGRPSRARVVIRGDAQDGVVVAVLSSSPHIDGSVDRSRGSSERKRAKDQARWERKHGPPGANEGGAGTKGRP